MRASLKVSMAALALGSITATAFGADTTTQFYLDSSFANATTGITNFGRFLAGAGLNTDNPNGLPYTPTLSLLAKAYRVYGNDTNPPVIVQFKAPVSHLRIFPNMDNPVSGYDGYQYMIWGSNDKKSWTKLFDAQSVETLLLQDHVTTVFILRDYTGTAPTRVGVGLVSTGKSGVGPSGTLGYVADFQFPTAYTFYKFTASSLAISSGNVDQEFSAIAEGP